MTVRQFVTECPECGSTDLSWSLSTQARPSGYVVPMLYQGCAECSETTDIVNTDAEVAQVLRHEWEKGRDHGTAFGRRDAADEMRTVLQVALDAVPKIMTNRFKEDTPHA